MSDSRAGAYVEEHGESSWELDAIPPLELAPGRERHQGLD